MFRSYEPGSSQFDKPVDNIGDKSFGGASGYETYANQHIFNVAIPGRGAGRMFVGQRKEPFFIAIGKIFDVLNFDPVGPEVNGNKNDLENKSISTIALEVPITCLTNGTEPVIGGYMTSSLRQGRLLNGVTVVASEMLRLNTITTPVAAGLQYPLGVAAGDNAGFPNGRRPGDDVVDIQRRLCRAAARQYRRTRVALKARESSGVSARKPMPQPTLWHRFFADGICCALYPYSPWQSFGFV